MELSSLSTQPSVQQLVDQYMVFETQRYDNLVSKKEALNDKKSVFSELDSKLTALRNKMVYFNDVITNPFYAKKASSSDSEKMSVSADGDAVDANHTVTAERLAKADTRVSNQFTSADSSFAAIITDQTFTIEVGHPTDEDATNRVQIEVTVNAEAFTGTDQEVLDAISEAISTSMGQAVTDEIIDADEIINASVVHEESGTSRLVLGSAQTGYSYRMDFGASTLLDQLNVNNAVQTTGNTGGFITDPGTNATDSELNSKFMMDGLTFYRDSNTITDAADGVTFRFLDTFSSAETATIATDKDTVKADVEEFLNAYNEVIEYMREQGRINSDTYERGPLTSDIIYSGITMDLRSMVTGTVSSTTSDEFTMLYHIGIEAEVDGTLKLKDVDKFNSALETNAMYVSDLFTSDEGVATRIEDFVDKFIKTGGTIDSSKENVRNEIDSIEDRIRYENDVLAKKEKQYFEEFSKLQETMYLLQNQQEFINSFLNFSTF